jgi:hypothetical protein
MEKVLLAESLCFAPAAASAIHHSYLSISCQSFHKSAKEHPPADARRRHAYSIRVRLVSRAACIPLCFASIQSDAEPQISIDSSFSRIQSATTEK